MGQERLALLVSLYFSMFCNQALWRSFAASSDLASAQGWRVAATLFITMTLLQWGLLVAVMTRLTAKPLLTLVIATTAGAVYYMNHYLVYVDPDMVRNVVRTEPKEAFELLTPGLVLHMLLYAIVPIALVWRVRIKPASWKKTVLKRVGTVAGIVLLCVVVVGFSFQDLAALMRNHKEMRYLITPGNIVTSLTTVLAGDAVDSGRPLNVVGQDARVVAAPGSRPRLLVIVVGETVRAQNWGLNGYARQTTPELANLDVFNFPDVTACGSSTEVSLPCMFSFLGRARYDEREIKRSQSLLHVLEHAGIPTSWRDNQTGCKGVCTGLAFESFLHADDPAYCDGQRCLDEILLDGLPERVNASIRDQVVVLHQLGNHGPSYFSRYPGGFRRFEPTCETAQLGDCSQQQIVNAYDNAILYTDHFLARTIGLLESQAAFDTAMLYVSDHGESLGERNLYLHGIPYAIAPDVQVKVPMVMWLSPRWRSGSRIDAGCIRERVAAPASHDNLSSTVLGLMRVRTSLYQPDLDLLAGCGR